jgi:hypothetical protein
MKIKDLIKELQKHDPEMQVIRNGYEGGVDFVAHVACYEVALDVNEEWWYGKHEIVHQELDISKDYENHKKTQAVLIS